MALVYYALADAGTFAAHVYVLARKEISDSTLQSAQTILELGDGEEKTRGRQIWCHAAETLMKSERHFWATVNYFHPNPVTMLIPPKVGTPIFPAPGIRHSPPRSSF